MIFNKFKYPIFIFQHSSKNHHIATKTQNFSEKPIKITNKQKNQLPQFLPTLIFLEFQNKILFSMHRFSRCL